jgi:hypothetical protein
MKKIFTAIFLIFVGGGFLFAQKKSEKEKICISEEELAVYKIIGVGNFQNETSRYSISDSDYMKRKFPNISPETVADYQAKNEKSQLLRCLDRKEGKAKKLKRSAAGIESVSFSRIGFNLAKTEALVYTGYESAGNDCGYYFILLRKNNEIWEIIERVNNIIC